MFDTADLVDDDEETKARKMSCCSLCRIQDGDIDPANRAPGRTKLVGGVDDYCFTPAPDRLQCHGGEVFPARPFVCLLCFIAR